MSSQNLSYNTLFISPPLSPRYNKGGIDNSLCGNTQNLPHEEPNNSSQNSTITTNPKINNQTQNKPKSIYRFRLRDAPKELLELINFSSKTLSGNSFKTSVIIGNTNYINGPFSADTTDTNNDRVTVATQNSLNLNTDNKKINNFNNTDNKISKNVIEKRQRVRKNPYPKKSPSKISPGITCSVDIFKAYKENPKFYLDSIYPLPKKQDPLFSDELFPYSDSETNITKKRKNRSKSRKLMANIEKLNLNMDILNNITPKITWKGQPLPITHLPYYDSLHPKEALVASTLRLNPLQYLTSKYTLISSALRYTEKSLPFRKSDAQKLLRIDVNKASKLWEFFSQIKWF
ncbi:10921_t:CDS:2 [Diversispora eburnea]|uniref:10921_t:CDS:1 n=1 Tax=Diversispora eburnea TaxID=1213867 RepID=A0A9N8YMH5_9GLOM|nr:10921_t:CDS:2 [Diversispora eburnea]